MENEEDELVRRPYAERQLVVVSEEEILKAAQEAENDDDCNERDSENFLKAAGNIFMKGLDYSFRNSLLGIGIEAYQAWIRARNSGIPILPISRSQAASITFPPGHPRDGVLYVGHPAAPNVYYTMADFHRYLFEHKLCEAVDLLMSLGATVIRVEHISGWSRNFSSRLSVPLAGAGDSVDAELGVKSGKSNHILFEASLSGTSTPSIPDGLVWYPHESTWSSIARGRIKYGLKDFSIGVSYLDDFGINAGLRARVLKSGLDLGGDFEGHESTVWRLEGKFGEGGC
jgi:hypothetical protein